MYDACMKRGKIHTHIQIHGIMSLVTKRFVVRSPTPETTWRPALDIILSRQNRNYTQPGAVTMYIMQSHLFFCPAPDVLRFTDPLQDVIGKENDRSCIFECSLSEPYVEVEWRTTAGAKGDTAGYETVLKDGGKYRMNCEGKHHLLRITDLKMADAGSYFCVVVGQDDKQSCADLVVEGGFFALYTFEYFIRLLIYKVLF